MLLLLFLPKDFGHTLLLQFCTKDEVMFENGLHSLVNFHNEFPWSRKIGLTFLLAIIDTQASDLLPVTET